MIRCLVFVLLLVSCFDKASSTESENNASAGALASPTLSAKDWLNRLKQVVSSGNYEVSFIIFQAGQETIPYLWRHSVLEDGTHMEQLNLQNGPGREFIRVNKQVSVFEPDEAPYSVSSNNINGPIPSMLLHNPDMLYEGYEFVVVGRARISGRPAQQIRIVSRDNTRYSYHLWLDEETGMLLKLNMLDQQANVLEQIQITSFSFSEQPHPYFSRVNQAVLPVVMAMPETKTEQLEWEVGFVPVGMSEIKRDTRRLAVSGQVVEYRLFSDGMVDVSVYVESAAQSFNQDVLLRHNLNTFLSLTNGNVQVTVVGEVPPETANKIAQSLTLSGSR